MFPTLRKRSLSVFVLVKKNKQSMFIEVNKILYQRNAKDRVEKRHSQIIIINTDRIVEIIPSDDICRILLDNGDQFDVAHSYVVLMSRLNSKL
jgi:hypothetical protein